LASLSISWDVQHCPRWPSIAALEICGFFDLCSASAAENSGFRPVMDYNEHLERGRKISTKTNSDRVACIMRFASWTGVKWAGCKW
jgi:hypothetical protein